MKIEVKSAPHRRVSVADILPNPHRDLKANPPNPEQVDKLLDSIGRTGFWDNIVVRDHPSREGKYQLAYGHNRLAALKDRRVEVDTITIPVVNLTDWEMYCAMVDENETQAVITPTLVMENVGAGARLIEAFAKDATTAEEFLANFGLTAAGGAKSIVGSADSFGRIKARIERGEGPGGDVVMALIPSAKLHHNVVRTVLGSLYGQAREAAKRKQAKAKEAEAVAKRKKAEAEKDAERAEKYRKQAEEADAEAAKLEREAVKLAKDDIAPAILLMMPSNEHMVEFASQVRDLGIPQGKHKKLAKLILDEEWSKRDVRAKTSVWWDAESGAQAARQRKVAQQQKLDKLRRQISGGDVNAFLVKLDGKLGDLLRDLKIAADAAQFGNDKIRSKIIRHWPQYADLISLIVERAAAPPAEIIDVTPTNNPKLLSHQQERAA